MSFYVLFYKNLKLHLNAEKRVAKNLIFIDNHKKKKYTISSILGGVCTRKRRQAYEKNSKHLLGRGVDGCDFCRYSKCCTGRKDCKADVVSFDSCKRWQDRYRLLPALL